MAFKTAECSVVRYLRKWTCGYSFSLGGIDLKLAFGQRNHLGIRAGDTDLVAVFLSKHKA